ncbi:hypothetical protein D3C86_2264160 [compost metagenome]
MTSLHVLEDDHGGDEGGSNPGDGHGMSKPARNDPAEKAGDHCPKQWCKGNEKVKFLHFHG